MEDSSSEKSERSKSSSLANRRLFNPSSDESDVLRLEALLFYPMILSDFTLPAAF